MLETLVKKCFDDNNGIIKTHTLRRTNRITFTVTDDKQGFVCSKGSVVFPFKYLDELEKELQMVAKYNHGKVYFGTRMSQSDFKMGDDPWFENTIDGILARRFFSIPDGKAPYRCSTYISALLREVGFAIPYQSDSVDAYIKLR